MALTMTKFRPDPKDIIALRLMHLGHLDNYMDKALCVIADLRVHGYEISRASKKRRIVVEQERPDEQQARQEEK
jgi:hypothetical protein